MTTKATEEILAAPLPALIRDLGLAVASANKELSSQEGDVVYAIDSAAIDLNVAVSISRTTDTSIGGSLGIQAFSVNASYASSYNFDETASSRITLHLRARPTNTAPSITGAT